MSMQKFTFCDFILKNVHHRAMNNLAKYRKSKGLLQKDVARMLGIATNTYSCYETGTNEPSISILLNLADIFDVTVDELLGRSSSDIFDNARIEQPEILQLYEKMTPEEQSNLVNYARGLISGRELRASYESRKNRLA